jgi:hypothetical protein
MGIHKYYFMDNNIDKNLTAQGFDESPDYTAPKMSDDITAEDVAAHANDNLEPGDDDDDPVDDVVLEDDIPEDDTLEEEDDLGADVDDEEKDDD